MAEPAEQRRQQQDAQKPANQKRILEEIAQAQWGSWVRSRVACPSKRSASVREGRSRDRRCAAPARIVRHHQHRHLALERHERLVEPARGALVEAARRARRESAARAADRARSPAARAAARRPTAPTTGGRRSRAARRVRAAARSACACRAATPKQTGRRCRVSARKSATVTGSVRST